MCAISRRWKWLLSEVRTSWVRWTCWCVVRPAISWCPPRCFRPTVSRRSSRSTFSFNASRAAFEQLRVTKGTIIYISAGMAYMPHAFQVHVGAAKAGIDMMMKNLAIEWGQYGIRANSIVPGPIEGTEGMKRLSSNEPRQELITAIPLRRMGTVDDIGQTAVFLASPLASYVSGCVVVVDGGQNLIGSAFFNAGVEEMLRAQSKTRS